MNTFDETPIYARVEHDLGFDPAQVPPTKPLAAWHAENAAWLERVEARLDDPNVVPLKKPRARKTVKAAGR